MSHNYPYRSSPGDFSLRQGAFSTGGNLHHEDRDIYQTSHQPSPRSMSVFKSSKTSLESYSSRSSTTAESALSLLSSCGLEPEDLSILTGMPENMITEETLPHLLIEIKQKKALRDHSGPSNPRHGTCHQPLQPPSDKCSSSAKYPTNPSQHSSYLPISPLRSSYPLPREETESWKDRGNPRPASAVQQEKYSSTYVVDYNYGHPQERDSRNLERPCDRARAVGIRERPHVQSSSDIRKLNPGREPAAAYQQKPLPPFATTGHSTPTAREANDFHGAVPQTFPHACSLCDIVVLSQKDWTIHINGSQHADSQLAVLQMYPNWDCRAESARRSDYYSQKGRQEENTQGRRHGAPRHLGVPSSCEGISYPAGDKAGGRVVCAKYAANTVDEKALRRLVAHVGTAVHVMVFPVQAFIEMSSPDEAEHVVKYFSRNPVVVDGNEVRFSMSATYNAVQISPVVIFSLLPHGNEKYPEIMAIAKRIGPVKNSLFLPNRVLLEMGSREDARKLVQHYTTHPLKMKGKIIQVSHSKEHNTLKYAVNDKESEDGEASRYRDQAYRSQNRSCTNPSRRSPCPRRTSSSQRRPSPSTRRRSYSPRRRSPSPRRPCSLRRSSDDRKSSRSPRRKSRGEWDGDKVEDKASQERTRSSSRHRSSSSRRSTSHIKEGAHTSRGHSVEKTADVKGDIVLTETADQGGSQESVSSPGDHSEAVFEGGKESDMDSDIEGMAVIGEDEEMRSEEGSVEFQEEMEMRVCDKAGTERISTEELFTCPSEVAEAGEEEKQLETEGGELALHPDKEPVSEIPIAGPAMSESPGVNAVQEERQDEGQEVTEEPNALQEERRDEGQEATEEPNALQEERQDEGQEATEEPNALQEERQDEGQEVTEEPNALQEERQDEGQEATAEPNAVQEERQDEGQEVTEEPNALQEERQDEGQEVTEEPNEIYEEDEPDFPESLEDCITLDEFEDEDNEGQALASEDNSNQGSWEEEQENDRGRVLYIRNLPGGYYTDKKFVAIGKKYGKVNRYFLIRHRNEGFIEMETSADAQRAVRELKNMCVTMDRCVLHVDVSKKYNRLTRGWSPESDSGDETRQRRHPRERRGREERENSSSKTKSRKKEEPPAKKVCIREEMTTPAEPNSSVKEEKAATEDPNNRGELQQQKEENGTSETPCEQEKLVVKTENESVTITQPNVSMDTQKQDTEEETSAENSDGLRQVRVEEEKLEVKTDTTHVPLGPYLPNNPMGREFVSEKIGYFCSLCNAIYVTEDEARNEHCSSLSHFEKLKAYLERNSNPN